MNRPVENTGVPLLLKASGAAMELCWLTAWAVYSSLLVTRSPFPSPLMIAVFIIAAGLTRRISRSAKMRWHLIAAHLLAYGASLPLIWWLARQLWPIDLAWGWQAGWRAGIFTARPDADAQWPVILFLALWTLVYWRAGVAWSNRAHTHQMMCNRFDLGAALLFLLFMLKWWFLGSSDAPAETFRARYLPALFIIFGLLSIGWAKKLAASQYDPKTGFGNVGMSAVFILVIALFGLCAIPLSLSPHDGASQIVIDTIKTVTVPLVSLFGRLLVFLFKPSIQSAGRQTEVQDQPGTGGQVDSIISQNDAYMHASALVYVILLIVLSAGAIWAGYRWLTGRPVKRNVNAVFFTSGWTRVIGLLQKIISFAHRQIWVMIKQKGATDYYAALVRWGNRSGIGAHPSETPNEYALRLAARFPKIRAMVTLITEHYNRYVYGGCQPDKVILKKLQSAIKKLRSPKFWPGRVKSWIMRR